MITVILLILSLCINATLAWTTYVQYIKNAEYEKELLQSDEIMQSLYDRVSATLYAMRTLDEKKMFESDDEVGSVFGQLVDIVNDMRPMLYETENAKK